MIYLDASLVVSAIVAENSSDQVVTWLLEQKPRSLVVSEWCLVEVASALAFKSRTGQIDEGVRIGAIAAWSAMRTSKIAVQPVPHPAFVKAEVWLNGGQTKLRSGDALHIAIAHTGGHRLATLDKAMAQAAAQWEVGVELIS